MLGDESRAMRWPIDQATMNDYEETHASNIAVMHDEVSQCYRASRGEGKDGPYSVGFRWNQILSEYLGRLVNHRTVTFHTRDFYPWNKLVRKWNPANRCYRYTQQNSTCIPPPVEFKFIFMTLEFDLWKLPSNMLWNALAKDHWKTTWSILKELSEENKP